mgnify:FL=1
MCGWEAQAVAAAIPTARSGTRVSSFQRIPPAPSWPARRNTGYSGLSPHSGRRETPGRTMHSCSGGHQTRHRLFSLTPGRRVLACRCSRAGEEKDPSKHYRIPVSFVHVQVQVLNHREKTPSNRQLRIPQGTLFRYPHQLSFRGRLWLQENPSMGYSSLRSLHLYLVTARN